jgi:UDP-N-acetylmuramate-alanine ligase
MTVCFEPRSNTAASSRFQGEFQTALSGADRVYFGAVHRAQHMKPEERLNTVAMAAKLEEGLGEAQAFASNEALFEQLSLNTSKETGGLIVFFTNGSFDGLPQRLASLH